MLLLFFKSDFRLFFLVLSFNICNRYRESMNAIQSDDHAAAIDALDKKWRLELDNVNADHTQKVRVFFFLPLLFFFLIKKNKLIQKQLIFFQSLKKRLMS
jgi:hypothetical protein